MESAWKEVENGAVGPGAGVGDPDLQAVWDDQDDAAAGGIETLEGVWGRTAARLEAGEGKSDTKISYCSMIRFSKTCLLLLIGTDQTVTKSRPRWGLTWFRPTLKCSENTYIERERVRVHVCVAPKRLSFICAAP